MAKVLSPVWHYPNVWNGRIAPSNSIAQDLDVSDLGYYAGTIYYYDGLGEKHVFCLGTDEQNLPTNRLKLDDVISVQQEFTIPSPPRRLLKFAWHCRMPTLPQSRNIVENGQVSFKTAGLISYLADPAPSGWSGTEDIMGIHVHNPDSDFTTADQEQVCYITGATDVGNNGYWRISMVPIGTFGPQGDTVSVTGGKAIIENDALTSRENDTGVTVRVLGLKWIARAYVDTGSGWVEKVYLDEQPNHTWYRNVLALHLSQYTGNIRIKFELKLEQDT